MAKFTPTQKTTLTITDYKFSSIFVGKEKSETYSGGLNDGRRK